MLWLNAYNFWNLIGAYFLLVYSVSHEDPKINAALNRNISKFYVYSLTKVSTNLFNKYLCDIENKHVTLLAVQS